MKKKALSPFVDASGEKILVLLSASVERFSVSRVRDFSMYNSRLHSLTHAYGLQGPQMFKQSLRNPTTKTQLSPLPRIIKRLVMRLLEKEKVEQNN